MNWPSLFTLKKFLDGTNGFKAAQWGIFLFAVALYFPSLNGTAFWDDNLLVTGSPNTPTHSLVTAFSLPFGHYFRPLTSASFAIENAYAHGIPFFYHATNVLLHGMTAVLVCSLVFLLTKRKQAAVFAGLFFAAQPLQVGAVAWIGGRTDALSAFFLTSFLICLVQSITTRKWNWFIGAWLCFFLAGLSKEQAMAITPAIPLAVIVFGSKKWKDIWRICLPYGSLILIYILLWRHGGPTPKVASSSIDYAAILGLRTLAHYGLGFLAPNRPALISFTLENDHGLLWVGGGLLFAVGIGYFFRATWKANPILAWLGVCALLVYLPIGNVPPVAAYVLGPYRCAESGISVGCLFGIALAGAITHRQRIWAGLLLTNLVAGVGVTWWGVSVWLQPKPFFAAVVSNDPHFLAGVEQYGKILAKEGHYAESAALTGRALEWVMGSKDWAEPFLNTPNAVATPEVNERLRTNTGNPEYMEVGTIMADRAFSLARSRQPEAAILSIRDAMIIQPKNPYVHLLYSQLILHKDRSTAIRELEIAVQLNPMYGDAVVALAKQRIIDQRFQEADELMSKVKMAMGYNGYFWLELFDAKMGHGDYQGAREALSSAQHAVIIPQQSEIEKRQSQLSAAHR